MKVYRLAKEKPGRYKANDLSGNGAALAGGRWNPRGMRVVYTCCTPSTTVLETLVHLGGLMPAAHHFLVTIELPDALFSAALVPEVPADWDAPGRDPQSAIAIGQKWIEEGVHLAMKVPSVVCPADFNLLLNPLHPDMGSVHVLEVAPFKFDPRLFG
ncbi:RES domain-containing protein (plasmid) [Cupriavidus sp. H19C3]|uniref:RES family NAD+ phosphorylase n=1 Tax=Cupriavidus sp. H19C3 TaxID=3241603 RepID=UPI003BF7730B